MFWPWLQGQIPQPPSSDCLVTRKRSAHPLSKVPQILLLEPSLVSLSLRSDVISSITILSLRGSCAGRMSTLDPQQGSGVWVYRGTSLTRNSAPLGPYSRNMPWGLWWSWGGELDLTSSAPRWKVSEREEPSPCEGPAPPQILLCPWDNPGAKRWFLESTPIQMPPSGGGICGRLT
jgi:hypothetical protein